MPVTKAFLRETFTGPIGRAGVEIPRDELWRAKAMQCEGIGENWVATLQGALSARVSDAEFASAADRFPVNTPLTKEEFYYRAKFDEFFPGLDDVVVPWPGGCRAGGGGGAVGPRAGGSKGEAPSGVATGGVPTRARRGEAWVAGSQGAARRGGEAG